MPEFGRRPSPPHGGHPAVASGPSQGPAGHGLRILVVEDEIFVSLNACAVLESAGHEVVAIVANADEAVAKADTLRPDLVLMDIRLRGERDGIDAATEIWRRLGIRSLFVSAYTDDETRARAAAAEPAGFLAKPFTDHGLLSAVEALSGGS